MWVEDLAGVAARPVAMVCEVVSGGLAEYDRARGAEAGDLDRIAVNHLGKEARPLGVRRRGREAGHVVDRLGEDGDAVERAAQSSRAPPDVGGARFRECAPGERVDG